MYFGSTWHWYLVMTLLTSWYSFNSAMIFALRMYWNERKDRLTRVIFVYLNLIIYFSILVWILFIFISTFVIKQESLDTYGFRTHSGITTIGIVVSLCLLGLYLFYIIYKYIR